MITVAYSTREANPKYQEHIKKKVGNDVEILEYVNQNQFSLTEIYNKALAESKHNIVLFIHDDLILESDNIGKKLVKHFNNSDYGILTVASTTLLGPTGQWWADQSKMIGEVCHEYSGKRWLSRYSPNLGSDTIVPVVLGDGLF